jgi:hypothetical protein
MNAQIKCPTCSGVLKAKSGLSEGPCVFCETNLRVNVQIVVLNEPRAVSSNDNWRGWSEGAHKGRGPTPKLTRSGTSYLV